MKYFIANLYYGIMNKAICFIVPETLMHKKKKAVVTITNLNTLSLPSVYPQFLMTY
jgi:hypothetical protein